MNFNFLNSLKTNLINLDNDFYEDYEEAEEDPLMTIPDNKLKNGSKKYLMKLYAKSIVPSHKNDKEILELFKLAYEDNSLKAIKFLFYLRDRKDGLGKRHIFRVILNYLGNINDSIIKGNLSYIPEYGRWDDLYALFGTKLEGYVIDIFKTQLNKDLESATPSYLAKWLKSENTTSKTSRSLARSTRKLLGLSSKEYRETLSLLRNKINIVEAKISKGDWGNIKYGDVPYGAMRKYSKAFSRRDKERFDEYKKFNQINSFKEYVNFPNKILEKLAPYNIVENMLIGNENYDDNTYKELWDQLPNYLSNDSGDTLAIIGLSNDNINDVQANTSVYASIGTALYLMEKNTGRFRDYIISSKPTINLKRIRSTELRSRIYEVLNSSITSKVNIEYALDIVLYAGIKHGLTKESIPKRLLCITDNKCSVSILSKKANLNDPFLINAEEYENIKDKWERAGFNIPQIIVWCIDSKRDDSTIVIDNKDIVFAFGYSRKIFKAIISGKVEGDVNILDTIINSSRYDKIKDYWF